MEFFHPRHDPLSEWHRWFAWHPVRLKPGDGSAQPCVWWEWIERRIEIVAGVGGIFETRYYRKPQI